ncbi:MAG TPA: aspartate aminotransferase family protein [Candidatus Saccharicenans sp.]|jgi:acetylornithine/LysW-gamma-L-lysine aminotransferase|nr:aspartate aminotransferase family protein [Candidatus Saccharicenans sp.]HRD01366.1 aspartate aminotransferase family protein [Candidatus Saccharicenans sp.]
MLIEQGRKFEILQRRYLVDSYINRGLTFVRGEGCYLIDESGEKYLDLMSNYGVNIFGYNHLYLTQKIAAELPELMTLHGSFNNDLRALAAQELVSRCGHGLSRVQFSSSGAEAIEAALKFAVLATGRKKFLSCGGGFHGKTLGALSATYQPKYRMPFEPLLWDFKFIPYNDLDSLEEAADNNVAAFLLEPIQGEGGINVPAEGYLREVRRICQQRGVLLILDEIQAGAGRTGSFLASDEEIEEMDILCLGKGLAGGLPFGATLVSREIAEKIPRSIHTSTFGGNPLACAGLLATLELLNDALFLHVKEIGDYFSGRLRKIKSNLIVEVRGKGLMIGMEFKERRDSIIKDLQKRKILAVPAGSSVVRFLPPYIVEKTQIDECVEKLEEVIKSLK